MYRIVSISRGEEIFCIISNNKKLLLGIHQQKEYKKQREEILNSV